MSNINYYGVYTNKQILNIIYKIKGNKILESYRLLSLNRPYVFEQFKSIHDNVDRMIFMEGRLFGQKVKKLKETDAFLALL